MEEIVFFNGRFVPIGKAGPAVSSPGLLSGYGLFETMRSYQNRIVYFREHVERIRNSSKLIGMHLPYSSQLRGIIKKIIQLNQLKDAYVRLTLWKARQGTNILIIARKYRPYPHQKYKNGFSAGIATFKQNENSFLAGIKTTSRLLYELSLEQVKDKGFDEAIILNNRGYIAEGSRSNIFLVKDKELFTPALSCGCLNGITRRAMFNLAKERNLKIYEGNFTCQDLAEAEEAFLTNSLMGVMPLARVENRKIGKFPNNSLTMYFIKKYNLLLKNGT